MVSMALYRTRGPGIVSALVNTGKTDSPRWTNSPMAQNSCFPSSKRQQSLRTLKLFRVSAFVFGVTETSGTSSDFGGASPGHLDRPHGGLRPRLHRRHADQTQHPRSRSPIDCPSSAMLLSSCDPSPTNAVNIVPMMFGRHHPVVPSDAHLSRHTSVSWKINRSLRKSLLPASIAA